MGGKNPPSGFRPPGSLGLLNNLGRPFLFDKKVKSIKILISKKERRWGVLSFCSLQQKK